MVDIKIDLKAIKKYNLTVQEYLTLLFLYVNRVDSKGYEEFIESFGNVSLNQMQRLQELKFIKIPDINEPEKYELREPSYKLFEGDRDLFLTWLNTFPIKTPSGRYLSPLRNDTISGKKLKKKWNKLFGKDEILKRKVIDTLEAELSWRLTNNTMEYIHNAETWLNQGDWEKYEYLLLTYKKMISKRNEDFI